MLKNILVIFFSVLYINSISAQKPARHLEITGTVHDVYNAPIANAIIMIDGKKTNSVTNSKGYYKVKIRKGASKIGVFTFGNGISEGYIDGRTRVNFNFSSAAALQSNAYSLDKEQYVDAGYGSVKKKNLTTDINKIDGTDKNYSTYSFYF